MSDAPFDIPLRFEALRGFQPVIRPLADGMRASTASRCVSCAVIEYLDPADERTSYTFNPGVEFCGHLFHQAWAHQVFGDAATVEVPIPWRHGLSHDDVVVTDGPWAGWAFEVKTHSDPKPKKPSAENIAQTRFRKRLRELADMTPLQYAVVMIGKAGNESGWVRGPFPVELADEHRDEIDARLTLIDELVRDADTLDTCLDARLIEHGCSRCFPKPRIDASAGVSDCIDRIVRRARVVAEIKADGDEADRARVKAALEDMPDVVLEGIWGDASLTKAGGLRVTPRKDAPWETM